MTMSQKKQLLVGLCAALIAAAGLGVYAFFGVFKPDQAEAERKELEAKLFALPVDELVELEIEAKDETTVLRREEGRWRLMAPVVAKADQDAVDTLLERLERSNRRKLIEEEGDPALFGLDEPVVRLVARTEGGEEAELLVGGQNTFDSSYFAMIRPNEIISIDGWLKGSFEKGSFELRDKKVLDLSIDEIEGVEVAGLSTWSVRRGEGRWELGSGEEADGAAVNDRLRALRDLKATGFHDQEDEADFGLDPPLLTATLHRKEGEPLQLRFGREGGKHFVRVSGGPIAEVPSTIVDELGEAPPVQEPPEETEPAPDGQEEDPVAQDADAAEAD